MKHSKPLVRAAKLVADQANRIASRGGVFDPGIEDDFVRIYSKCRDYTACSWERMYALYKAVRYTVEATLPGDYVECGVWRGGSVMMIASTLLSCGVRDRSIFLYDTFSGMSDPTSVDFRIADQKPAETWQRDEELSQGTRPTYASLDEVRGNVRSTGYPADRIAFVRGKVEDTIPGTVPEQISLLRLDTDWYESTRHELRHLYPRLTRGGVLIIDDYGHWMGARKAVDEYFAAHPPAPLLHRIDYTGRAAIKWA
jgi:O-methyltransferase